VDKIFSEKPARPYLIYHYTHGPLAASKCSTTERTASQGQNPTPCIPIPIPIVPGLNEFASAYALRWHCRTRSSVSCMRGLRRRHLTANRVRLPIACDCMYLHCCQLSTILDQPELQVPCMQQSCSRCMYSPFHISMPAKPCKSKPDPTKTSDHAMRLMRLLRR
jgi:hypothetical protein